MIILSGRDFYSGQDIDKDVMMWKATYRECNICDPWPRFLKNKTAWDLLYYYSNKCYNFFIKWPFQSFVYADSAYHYIVTKSDVLCTLVFSTDNQKTDNDVLCFLQCHITAYVITATQEFRHRVYGMKSLSSLSVTCKGG